MTEGQGAKAVPLHLKGEFGTGKGLAGLSQHGLQPARERCGLGVAWQRMGVPPERWALQAKALLFGVPVGIDELVGLLDPEPLVVLAGADQGEVSSNACSVKGELEIPLEKLLIKIIATVGSGVPDVHPAGAVVSGRDGALEVQVFQGVVFGVHGQAFDGRIQAGSARDGPGFQHSVVLQAQVVVQAPGVVALDGEAGELAAGDFFLTAGFGGLIEVALALVILEGHYPWAVTLASITGVACWLRSRLALRAAMRSMAGGWAAGLAVASMVWPWALAAIRLVRFSR